MIEGLRQITNQTLNAQISCANQLQKVSSLTPSIHELVSVNLQTIDFKQCITGTVHERKLGITLRNNHLQPKIICITIICEDQKLSDLPEYIFGVRKENSFQYFDEFKFKAAQRGTYNFIVGVKTPNLIDYNITGKLLVSVEGASEDIQVKLKQITMVPFVSCCKELMSEDGFRMIKLAAIKNKGKKETKITFKCSENITFTLLTELLSLNNCSGNEIEVKPKTIQVAGKGGFILGFTMNCPSELDKERICIRKILVLKIKDSECHFHFPIEAIFYPEGKQACLME